MEDRRKGIVRLRRTKLLAPKKVDWGLMEVAEREREKKKRIRKLSTNRECRKKKGREKGRKKNTHTGKNTKNSHWHTQIITLYLYAF